jgi:hypothetical protein
VRLWDDEPKFELQVLGRFVWKLVVVILLTFAVMAVIALVVDVFVDVPTVEIIER